MPSRPFSDQDVLIAWRGASTDSQAARTLGVSPSTLYHRRRKLGLPNRQGAQIEEWSQAQFDKARPPERRPLSDDAIRTAWRKARNDAEAARRLGISQSTFYVRRTHLGLPNRHEARLAKWWGTHHEAILFAWAVRMQSKWLASDLGVSESRLHALMTRFAIPHVSLPVTEKLAYLDGAHPTVAAKATMYHYRHATPVGQESDHWLSGLAEFLHKPPVDRRPLVPPPPA